MITIVWPGQEATHAEVWRLLDLGGITKSIRESRNFVKNGWVYFNGSMMTSLKTTVSIGTVCTLETRVPYLRDSKYTIMVVNHTPKFISPRSNSPTVIHRTKK